MVGVSLLSLLVASAPAASPGVTTTVPFDGLVQCLRDRLVASGRVTAINSAAGAMLDYAFDTVGTDGKVSPSHLSFTIEDHGTERSLAVSAPNPADAPLAQQYLRLVGGRCVAGGEPRAAAAHGAP